MDRRVFVERWVLVAAVAVLFGLSGCVGPIEPGAIGANGWDGDPDNHWESDVLSVSYEQPAGDDRDYEPLVHEALAYWTEHSQRYAGYDVGLRLADDGEAADIHVTFEEEVTDCGEYTEDVHTAGCAPVLTDANQIDRPVDIRVRTGLSNESTVKVMKHEIGHALGLTHDDEPQEVMAAQTELTTLPKTDAVDRELPWQTNELVVYVDARTEDDENEVDRQVGAALRYFMDGADGTVPENVTFYRADSPENAHVTVTVTDVHDCRSGPGSCGTTSGTDLDGNGELDYYTGLDIVVVDIDTDAVAWHVGRWLGTGFGHTDETEYPEPLRESASYEERRSEWWTE